MGYLVEVMSRPSDKRGWERQLESLREGLRTPPEGVEIAQLFPLFVPSTFFELGNWPGPYATLRASDVGLTWFVKLPDQSMRYVDNAIAQYWDKEGIDWKKRALLNLAEQTAENLATHEFRHTDGEPYAIAMMHADGIGPSRLMLQRRISSIFPDGYKVALPEMSCAFAFSVQVDRVELNQIQKLITTVLTRAQDL
jgi:hypothetical protein